MAARLFALLTVPLAVLVGLGVFTGLQLANIEARSRFVAESRIVALATLGNLSRSFAELRVNVRSHMLATTDARRAAARARFDEDERDVNRLLQEYADRLVLGDRDRRLLSEYQVLSREYIAGARQVMRLADEGRSADAIAYFENTIGDVGVRLSEVSNEWIAHDQQAAAAAGAASVAAVERFRQTGDHRDAGGPPLDRGARGRHLTADRQPDPGAGRLGQRDCCRRLREGRPVRPVPPTRRAGWRVRSTSSSGRGADGRTTLGQVARVPESPESCKVRPHVAEFGQRLLSNLVPILGGGVASFYVFDEAAGHLQRVAAYGLADVSSSPAFDPAR